MILVGYALLAIGLLFVIGWWASDAVEDGVDRVLGPRKDEDE